MARHSNKRKRRSESNGTDNHAQPSPFVPPSDGESDKAENEEPKSSNKYENLSPNPPLAPSLRPWYCSPRAWRRARVVGEFIFGAAVAIFAYVQWDAMRDQNAIMGRQSRQADQTLEQMRADTALQREVYEKNKLQQAARIKITIPGQIVFSKDKPIECIINVANDGVSDATDCAIKARIFYSVFPRKDPSGVPPPKYDAELLDGELIDLLFLKQPDTIRSGESKVYSVTRVPITEKQHELMNAGYRGALFTRVRFTYTDIYFERHSVDKTFVYCTSTDSSWDNWAPWEGGTEQPPRDVEQEDSSASPTQPGSSPLDPNENKGEPEPRDNKTTHESSDFAAAILGFEWDTIFSGMVACATVALVVTARYQLKKISRQIAQTDEVVKQMRLDQRAWLSIRNARIKKLQKGYNKLKCTIYVRNYGKTPGRIISGCIRHYVREKNSETKPIICEFEAIPDDRTDVYIAHPNDETPWEVGMLGTLGDDEIEAVRIGDKELHILVRMRYRYIGGKVDEEKAFFTTVAAGPDVWRRGNYCAVHKEIGAG